MKNIIKQTVSKLRGNQRWTVLMPSRRISLRVVAQRVASINLRTVMVVAALMGPVALFLPWLTLDGHTGSMSGASLMAYAFHGGDRLVMWHISKLGIITLVVIPFTVTTTVCLTAVNVVRRDYRLDTPVLTAASVLLLLRFTPPILSSQMGTVGSFTVPGPGLAVLLMGTVAVIGIGTFSRLEGRRQSAQSTP